jgi:hypothetical protein
MDGRGIIELRPWVPLPPGPFLSARELRHYFELIIGSCRTDSAAMHLSDWKEVYEILFDVPRFYNVSLLLLR